MQITSSTNSIYSLSNPSIRHSQASTTASLGDVVDKIKDEYQQLTPEQQRDAQLYLGEQVNHYQQNQQTERSVKRNLVLGVSEVNHQQKLLDAYYAGASGENKPGEGSQAISYQTLEGINDNLQQQKQVNQKLAFAELYVKYGESSSEPKPELYQTIRLEV